MTVRDHGKTAGTFSVRLIDGKTLPVSDAAGLNTPPPFKPWSPYRNVMHWLNYRTPTKSQLRNDEPPNLEGNRWQRK